MNWLLLAIVSYFLNAVVLVVDKFFISKKIKDPGVYAFYAAFLSIVVFVFWPLDFSFLSFWPTLFAVFSGLTFFGGIFYLYSAMATGEASRVVSIIGGISPMIILVLSYLFLGERLSSFWILAFTFLIVGSILLSLEEQKKAKFRLGIQGLLPLYSLLSAVFFALSFFLSKLVFLETSFLNGFIWIRVGPLLIVLILLCKSSFRKAVFQNKLNVSPRLPLFFVSNKFLSAAAFFVLSYSISLGSVAVVNALQGVQFAFIFILVVVFSFYRPDFLNESLSLRVVTQKIIGISLVSGGVALLFLS